VHDRAAPFRRLPRGRDPIVIQRSHGEWPEAKAVHGSIEISAGAAVVKVEYRCELSVSDVELDLLKQALETTSTSLFGRTVRAKVAAPTTRESSGVGRFIRAAYSISWMPSSIISPWLDPTRNSKWRTVQAVATMNSTTNRAYSGAAYADEADFAKSESPANRSLGLQRSPRRKTSLASRAVVPVRSSRVRRDPTAGNSDGTEVEQQIGHSDERYHRWPPG